MARILSFDIGKINLAYCLIEVNDDPTIMPVVQEWGKIDLTLGKGGKTTMRECISNLAKIINSMQFMWTYEIPTHVIIESQGQHAVALQSIGVALLGMLDVLSRVQYNKEVTTACITPSTKFKKFGEPNYEAGDTKNKQYTKRKQRSVEMATNFLMQWGDANAAKLFADSKNDRDLADAMTNACAYIQIHIRKLT